MVCSITQGAWVHCVRHSIGIFRVTAFPVCSKNLVSSWSSPPSFKNGHFLEDDLELLNLLHRLLSAERGWEGKETDLYTQFYLTLRDIPQSRCGQPISAVRLRVVVLGLRHWQCGGQTGFQHFSGGLFFSDASCRG